MKQAQRYTIAQLSDGGDKAVNGATLHPELVSINDAEAIELSISNMLGKRDAYENAKAAWSTSRQAAVQAKKVARETLTLGRDLLKKHLGSRYNQNWDSTGLVKTLEIPVKTEQVKASLQSFKAHFTANPGRENAGLNITAANFTTLHTNLVAAQNTAINGETAVKTAKNERDAAMRAMDKRLSDLFGELKMKLGTMDPRWTAFGFNMPGLKETPPTPGKVTATLVGTNALAVGWDPVPRTEYYRVWVKVKDADEAFRPVGNSSDRNFTIEDLPSNTEVEVAISAVNNGGESALSEIYKVTTA